MLAAVLRLRAAQAVRVRPAGVRVGARRALAVVAGRSPPARLARALAAVRIAGLERPDLDGAAAALARVLVAGVAGLCRPVRRLVHGEGGPNLGEVAAVAAERHAAAGQVALERAPQVLPRHLAADGLAKEVRAGAAADLAQQGLHLREVVLLRESGAGPVLAPLVLRELVPGVLLRVLLPARRRVEGGQRFLTGPAPRGRARAFTRGVLLAELRVLVVPAVIVRPQPVRAQVRRRVRVRREVLRDLRAAVPGDPLRLPRHREHERVKIACGRAIQAFSINRERQNAEQGDAKHPHHGEFRAGAPTRGAHGRYGRRERGARAGSEWGQNRAENWMEQYHDTRYTENQTQKAGRKYPGL